MSQAGSKTLRSGSRSEWLPATVTEKLLVREIARHAAMLELGEQAEGGVLRVGAASLAPMAISGDSDAQLDAALAAAVTTDAVERLTRYRRAHEKAFHQALSRLGELQAARRDQRLRVDQSTPRFSSEETCRDHLRARFSANTWRCPRCQRQRGYWMEAHDAWECASCGTQVGLRVGTVFARSRLPLVTWFAAIGQVIAEPGISAATLGRHLSLRRPATAQSLLKRIRQAINAGGAGLADVDVFYRSTGANQPA